MADANSLRFFFFMYGFFYYQERTIERLKEQRDRDEREKQEEIDNYKKDLKDLKEKVSLLQGDLSEKEVKITKIKSFGFLGLSGCIVKVFMQCILKSDERIFLQFIYFQVNCT